MPYNTFIHKTTLFLTTLPHPLLARARIFYCHPTPCLSNPARIGVLWLTAPVPRSSCVRSWNRIEPRSVPPSGRSGRLGVESIVEPIHKWIAKKLSQTPSATGWKTSASQYGRHLTQSCRAACHPRRLESCRAQRLRGNTGTRKA